jgi:hypothetical protein
MRALCYRLFELLHAILDIIVVLCLFFACGALMSVFIFTAVLTDALLRQLKAYTLRPYHYLHFKLALLRRPN